MTPKQMSKPLWAAGIAILFSLPTLYATSPTPTPPPAKKRGTSTNYSLTRTNARTQPIVTTTTASRTPARRISTSPNYHRPMPLTTTRDIGHVQDHNNKVPPKPHPNPGAKPDLVFVPTPSIQGGLGVLSDGQNFVRFHVKNLGPGSAPQCRVDLLIYETGDGGKIIAVKHQPVGALNATGSSDVTFTIPKEYYHKNAYRATIDPDDSVKESNEENNVSILYQFGAFPSAGN